jgi:YD repeat-containing protein
MVATAPASPSSFAGPSAPVRSASRIASDRRGATWVSPENNVSEQLAADRPTSITQGSVVTTFEYDDANRRARLTLPNGVKTEYAYDAASRLTGLTYKLGGATLGNLAYTYDPASQRTQLGGSWARTLLPAAVASATYDAANQQTAFNGQAQTFDLNGNLTGDGTNTYTWDVRNQLASISGPVPASFVYDPVGRRRQRKTINGTATDFVYDGLNPVKEVVGATTVNLLTGLARKAMGPRSRAKVPRPIPPRSVVELVNADSRTPAWKRQLGRQFRIGYYSPQDGLDTVWLVDDAGTYSQTADQASLRRFFRVIRLSRETDYYGRNRSPIRPRRRCSGGSSSSR